MTGTPEKAHQVLRPHPSDRLRSWRLSRNVNRVQEESPKLIEPILSAHPHPEIRAMTIHHFDDDNWPPDDPTDEELEALIHDLEEEPDLPEELEELPFADVEVNDEERNLQAA